MLGFFLSLDIVVVIVVVVVVVVVIVVVGLVPVAGSCRSLAAADERSSGADACKG